MSTERRSSPAELPAGFTRRPDGRVVVRYKDHDGLDRRLVRDSLEAAELDLLKALSPPPRAGDESKPPFVSRGSLGLCQNARLGSLIAWYEWFQHEVRGGRRKVAHKTADIQRQHLKAHLEDRAGAITKKDLARVLEDMREGVTRTKRGGVYSTYSRLGMLSAVRVLFRLAFEVGFISVNPSWDFSDTMSADNNSGRPRRHGTSVRRNLDYPSQAQFDALQRTADFTRDRMNLLLIGEAFLKECEVTAVTEQSFDFEARTVAVTHIRDDGRVIELGPDDHRRRVVPISDALAACAFRTFLVEAWGLAPIRPTRGAQAVLGRISLNARQFFPEAMSEIADGSLWVEHFNATHLRTRAVIAAIDAGATAFELEAWMGWESAKRIAHRYRKYFDRVHRRDSFDAASRRLTELLASAALDDRNRLSPADRG